MCEQIRIKQNQNIQLETSALISLYDEAAEEMMSYLVEQRRKSYYSGEATVGVGGRVPDGVAGLAPDEVDGVIPDRVVGVAPDGVDGVAPEVVVGL